MGKPFTGKVALVTGGSRGCAGPLAEQGSDGAFTCRNSAELAEAVVDDARAVGAKVVALRSDQADTGRATSPGRR